MSSTSSPAEKEGVRAGESGCDVGARATHAGCFSGRLRGGREGWARGVGATHRVGRNQSSIRYDAFDCSRRVKISSDNGAVAANRVRPIWADAAGARGERIKVGRGGGTTRGDTERDDDRVLWKVRRREVPSSSHSRDPPLGQHPPSTAPDVRRRRWPRRRARGSSRRRSRRRGGWSAGKESGRASRAASRSRLRVRGDSAVHRGARGRHVASKSRGPHGRRDARGCAGAQTARAQPRARLGRHAPPFAGDQTTVAFREAMSVARYPPGSTAWRVGGTLRSAGTGAGAISLAAPRSRDRAASVVAAAKTDSAAVAVAAITTSHHATARARPRASATTRIERVVRNRGAGVEASAQRRRSAARAETGGARSSEMGASVPRNAWSARPFRSRFPPTSPRPTRPGAGLFP